MVETMTETFKPEDAVKQTQEAFEQASVEFEKIADAAVPEAFRALAEKTVNQSREAYERSKGLLEEAIDALERSIDAAGQGVVALNRKSIDIAQRNLNTGFDLAKSVAGARTVAEMLELQTAFVRKQFDALAGQAEEVRSLATKVAADTTEPIKSHVTRSFEKYRKAS
jgi:phasin